MFTFVILTYNHSNYIIEHLESIKYQIDKYAHNLKIELIISDDFSSDNTISIAKEWLSFNQGLFSSFKIIESSRNKGLVHNYLSALKEVNGSKYKLLAGDDIYYMNNIFEAIQEEHVTFSPIIKFNSSNIIKELYINDLFLIKNFRFKSFKRILRQKSIFNAPGTFLKKEILDNPEFFNFISKYKWIEDLPQLYYLFFIKKNIDFRVDTKPYILYRINSGISTRKNQEVSNKFIEERTTIAKDLNIKLYKKYKLFNPYKIYWRILTYKILYFDKYLIKRLKEFNKMMGKEYSEAEIYLREIQVKSKEFYKNI